MPLSSSFAVIAPNFLLKRLLARMLFFVRRYPFFGGKALAVSELSATGASPCGEDGVEHDMDLFVAATRGCSFL